MCSLTAEFTAPCHARTLGHLQDVLIQVLHSHSTLMQGGGCFSSKGQSGLLMQYKEHLLGSGSDRLLQPAGVPQVLQECQVSKQGCFLHHSPSTDAAFHCPSPDTNSVPSTGM